VSSAAAAAAAAAAATATVKYAGNERESANVLPEPLGTISAGAALTADEWLMIESPSPANTSHSVVTGAECDVEMSHVDSGHPATLLPNAAGESTLVPSMPVGSVGSGASLAQSEKLPVKVPPTVADALESGMCGNGCEGTDARATHWCADCEIIVCSFCVAAHQRRGLLKTHCLTEIDGNGHGGVDPLQERTAPLDKEPMVGTYMKNVNQEKQHAVATECFVPREAPIQRKMNVGDKMNVCEAFVAQALCMAAEKAAAAKQCGEVNGSSAKAAAKQSGAPHVSSALKHAHKAPAVRDEALSAADGGSSATANPKAVVPVTIHVDEAQATAAPVHAHVTATPYKRGSPPKRQASSKKIQNDKATAKATENKKKTNESNPSAQTTEDPSNLSVSCGQSQSEKSEIKQQGRADGSNQWYTTKNNDTPRTIAKRLQVQQPKGMQWASAPSPEEIIRLNVAFFPELKLGSKLRSNTMIFIGEAEPGASSTAGTNKKIGLDKHVDKPVDKSVKPIRKSVGADKPVGEAVGSVGADSKHKHDCKQQKGEKHEVKQDKEHNYTWYTTRENETPRTIAKRLSVLERSSLIGMTFKKDFPPHGIFNGTVALYFDSSETYLIKYEDGDSEVVSYRDMPSTVTGAHSSSNITAEQIVEKNIGTFPELKLGSRLRQNTRIFIGSLRASTRSSIAKSACARSAPATASAATQIQSSEEKEGSEGSAAWSRKTKGLSTADMALVTKILGS